MLLTRKFQRAGRSGRGHDGDRGRPPAAAGTGPDQGPAGAGLLGRLPVRIAAGSRLARRFPTTSAAGTGLVLACAKKLPSPLPDRSALVGLPPTEPADTVLCAVYHRVFLGE